MMWALRIRRVILIAAAALLAAGLATAAAVATHHGWAEYGPGISQGG
jgi:Spy/CpxP family protein refolding chaperone